VGISDEMVQASVANKLMYCEDHKNVDCIINTEFRDLVGDFRFNVTYRQDQLSSKWYKFPLILENLDSYEWVICIDSDTLILNRTKSIEDALKSSVDDQIFDGKDVIFTVDHNGVNLGAFVVRNSDWSKVFLNHLYDQRGSVTFAHKFNLTRNRRSAPLQEGWADQNALIIVQDSFYSLEQLTRHTLKSSKLSAMINNFCLVDTRFIHHRVFCHSINCDKYFLCLAQSVTQTIRCEVPTTLKDACNQQKKYLNLHP
jgi:hypothetical protein